MLVDRAEQIVPPLADRDIRRIDPPSMTDV
jgi:hypothetical protein